MTNEERRAAIKYIFSIHFGFVVESKGYFHHLGMVLDLDKLDEDLSNDPFMEHELTSEDLFHYIKDALIMVGESVLMDLTRYTYEDEERKKIYVSTSR